MNPKTATLSLYDFLGYLVPGALAIYIGIAAYQLMLGPSSLSELVSAMGFGTAGLLPFFLVAYASGHMLSFLSALTVERFAVSRHDYPSRYLLRSTDVAHSWEGGWNWPSTVFLLPISLLSATVGHIFERSFARPIHECLQAAVAERIRRLLNTQRRILHTPEIEVDLQEVEFFHLVYHYVIERESAHIGKLHNHIALSGFLRTLTLIVVLTFWALVPVLLVAGLPLVHCAYTLPATAVAAYLSYLAFLKFNRRFTFETLMAFAVIHSLDDTPNQLLKHTAGAGA